MTNIYLTTTAADAAVTVGSDTKKLGDWAAGGASQLYNKNTVVGPTSGVQLTDGTSLFTDGTPISWYSKPLQAVTIAGQIVASLWGREASSTDNSALCLRLERCSGNGTVLSTIVDQSSTNQGGLELPTTGGGDAVVCTAAAADVVDTALVDGDRLRISLWFRDASSQGGTGTQDADASVAYVNGATGGAGQAQFAFTETLTEFTGGGGTTVGLGQPAETDTAQPLGLTKTLVFGTGQAFGLPTETDTAQPVITVKTRVLGQAVETDAAQPLTLLKSDTLGQALELSTASALTAAKARGLGQATEADTAAGLLRGKTVILGIPAEADQLFALTLPAAPIVGLPGNVHGDLDRLVGAVVIETPRGMIGGVT